MKNRPDIVYFDPELPILSKTFPFSINICKSPSTSDVKLTYKSNHLKFDKLWCNDNVTDVSKIQRFFTYIKSKYG